MCNRYVRKYDCQNAITDDDIGISCVGYRKLKNVTVDPAVFSCISMLAMSTGPTKEMITNIEELLESMFSVGLRYVTGTYVVASFIANMVVIVVVV